MNQNDTVCAVMTPLVSGATGSVRISGPEAFTIAEKVFSLSLANKPGHTLHFGTVFSADGKPLDQAVASVYKAPKSFTGEDVVEFSCHGSVYVLSSLVRALISHGARQASRGEFSKRAFINGKMDMTQAQAIMDLIESESETEARVAYRHLSGGLSAEIEAIRSSLLDTAAQILAYIDYPDDEIEDLSPEVLGKTVSLAKERVCSLKNTFSSGKLIKEGVTACLCGKPNVGKSMLLNRLAGFERSIVTSIAGTTRDAVEQRILFGGLKVSLWDTAGLRGTEDEVEKIGVSLAEQKIKQAQLIFALFDGSRPFDDEDREVLSLLEHAAGEKIALINKTDLFDSEKYENREKIKENLCRSGLFDCVLFLSAKTGDGIPLLEEKTEDLFGKIDPDSSEIVTDQRQYECLCRAEEALSRAVENLALTSDALLEDIEQAAEALGMVTGKSVGEEVIETIFSRFCVGK